MSQNPPKRRFSRIRCFFAILCGLVLIWKVVVGYHDIFLNHDGLNCIQGGLGLPFMDHWNQNRKWVKKNRWNSAAVSYIENIRDQKKQEATVAAINSKCSEYFYMGKALTMEGKDDGYSLILDNWGLLTWGNPAIPSKRQDSMILWGILFFFCAVDLRRVKDIFIWSRSK